MVNENLNVRINVFSFINIYMDIKYNIFISLTRILWNMLTIKIIPKVTKTPN